MIFFTLAAFWRSRMSVLSDSLGAFLASAQLVRSDSTLRLVLHGSSGSQQIFYGHAWLDVTPAPPDFVSAAAVPSVFGCSGGCTQRSSSISLLFACLIRRQCGSSRLVHHNMRLLDTSSLWCWRLKMSSSCFPCSLLCNAGHFSTSVLNSLSVYTPMFVSSTRILAISLTPTPGGVSSCRSCLSVLSDSILFRSTIPSSLWALLFCHLCVSNSRKFSTINPHISFSLLCLIFFLMFLSLSWLWWPCSFSRRWKYSSYFSCPSSGSNVFHVSRDTLFHIALCRSTLFTAPLGCCHSSCNFVLRGREPPAAMFRATRCCSRTSPSPHSFHSLTHSTLIVFSSFSCPIGSSSIWFLFFWVSVFIVMAMSHVISHQLLFSLFGSVLHFCPLCCDHTTSRISPILQSARVVCCERSWCQPAIVRFSDQPRHQCLVTNTPEPPSHWENSVLCFTPAGPHPHWPCCTLVFTWHVTGVSLSRFCCFSVILLCFWSFLLSWSPSRTVWFTCSVLPSRTPQPFTSSLSFNTFPSNVTYMLSSLPHLLIGIRLMMSFTMSLGVTYSVYFLGLAGSASFCHFVLDSFLTDFLESTTQPSLTKLLHFRSRCICRLTVLIIPMTRIVIFLLRAFQRHLSNISELLCDFSHVNQHHHFGLLLVLEGLSFHVFLLLCWMSERRSAHPTEKSVNRKLWLPLSCGQRFPPSDRWLPCSFHPHARCMPMAFDVENFLFFSPISSRSSSIFWISTNFSSSPIRLETHFWWMICATSEVSSVLGDMGTSTVLSTVRCCKRSWRMDDLQVFHNLL